MKLRIAVFPGDGIGPEVCAEAVAVLQALNLDLELHTAMVGGCAIEALGTALPDQALSMAQDADAVLFGAVGMAKFDRDPTAKVRPEQAILGLRKGLGLFANLRPVKAYDALLDASTLKPEVIRDVDLIILRELTGGAYFGKPQGQSGEAPHRQAVDTTAYTEEEVRRLMIMAFELARARKKKVTQADKANVMATGRLWRQIAHEIRDEYPDVEYEDMYADACAMYLLRNPRAFDIIATENLFGDILSDEAAMLTGSMGMLPSASLGDAINRHGYRRGLYEPIHGAAHDIAGQGVANPLAMILSAALMLRWSFGRHQEAERIERAVERALNDGLRCSDIKQPGTTVLGTREMGQAVIARL
ncbi:MAG: 3-isopropylmalate dehydrogenase [Thermoflexales bacterium]|nr:3-isopropylmalate dehydrogenase [Thermoflexales bacterium]MDW8350306.1 3-isopropylmalate dehydrogenase [Anaerolineae bacterium]